MTMNDMPQTSDVTDEAPSLQGKTLDCSQAENVDAIIAQAVDYRGDVILELLDGSQVEGYLYDRRPTDNPPIARM